MEASSAVKAIRGEFPKADIAFSSILQRREKSPGIITMNKTVQTVKEYMCELSVKEDKLYYRNNDDDMVDRGIPIKSMYDLNDTMGVHASSKGAEILEENSSGLSSQYTNDTSGNKKRNRSVLSITPPSDKQMHKTSKTVQK